MARQGYDLQFTRYDDRGWRTTFYAAGMEHSPTSATGTGWEKTPWRAVRRPMIRKVNEKKALFLRVGNRRWTGQL